MSYYTLRYQHNDVLNKAGARVAAARDTLRIGEQEDCEVRFSNTTRFADELYAVVRPDDDECNSWTLVPCSEFVRTIVNGVPVSLLHHLNEGDRIRFETDGHGEQELLFNIRHDDKLNGATGTVYMAAHASRKTIAMLVALPVILFLLTAIWLTGRMNESKERLEALWTMKESVLQISVDSVYYCYFVKSTGKTIIHDTFSYVAEEDHAINGTAFITVDSLLVTARHCIEPWLNNKDILEMDDPMESNSTPVLWALMAETYNQQHADGDTIHRLVSVCDLYSGDNGTMSYGRKYRSSEFRYDDSRDDIIEMGDFSNDYYWRSIARNHSRTDMMMGDLAVAHSDFLGKIVLADSVETWSLVQVNRPVFFMGYPDYQNKGFEQAEGKVRLPMEANSLIAHDGNLVHGYSGGPAFVFDGMRPLVVGIVSVTDSNGGNRMYSVPVCSIIKKGGKK